MLSEFNSPVLLSFVAIDRKEGLNVPVGKPLLVKPELLKTRIQNCNQLILSVEHF